MAVDPLPCCATKDRERKHAYLASIIESELTLELDWHRMLLSGSVLTRWLVASGTDAQCVLGVKSTPRREISFLICIIFLL